MHTPSGKDTETFLKELEKEKKKKAIDVRIAQKSKENEEKKHSKRILKNVPSTVKSPIRAYARITKGVFIKGLGIDKLQETVQTRKEEKITLNAEDIANAILKDYVKSTNAKMTSNEFQSRIEEVERKKFSELTRQDALLKSWIEDTKAKQGTAQVQRLVSNFKDINFSEDVSKRKM